MIDQAPYRIYPLGDSAITLDYGNIIDEIINQKIIAFFHLLNEKPLQGMIEAVPAYSSITIYYDVIKLKKITPENNTISEWMSAQLEKKLELLQTENELSPRLIKIPVCYEKEYAPDIDEIALIKNISVGKIIQIHTSKTYRVYMLGFLPGFAYMGQVDEQIEMPRRSQPRQKVEAGSVGITGKQTGIYPFVSPGGWQIIGRTPLNLFDVMKKEPTLLIAGDSVQFYSISKNEFESY